jgi:hypothetical protein
MITAKTLLADAPHLSEGIYKKTFNQALTLCPDGRYGPAALSRDDKISVHGSNKWQVVTFHASEAAP